MLQRNPLYPLALLCLVFSLGLMAHEETGGNEPEITAITASDPDIPVDELGIMLKPLTADELKVEAKAWMELLQEKTHQTSLAELAIKQKNKAIDRAEEVQEAIEDTQDALEELEDASQQAKNTGSVESAEEVQALAAEAREAVEQTVGTIEDAVETRIEVAQDGAVEEALSQAELTRARSLTDQADVALEASAQATAAADDAVTAAESGNTADAARLSAVTERAAAEATDALQSSSNVIDEAIAERGSVDNLANQAALDNTARLAAEAAERETEDKKEILISVAELRTQRTALSDRLNVVLDELSAKLGKTADGQENEFILPFRLYSDSINTIEVDVTDTQSLWSNIIGWLRSDLGGVRLARNLGLFLLSVISFWVLGWVLGKLVDRTLRLTRITAELMRSVIVRTVRRVTVLIGIIVGLAAMDINVGPILAVIGAAGFVIAFALQNTLSNFASGIMIMIYKPFDVGDLITVGGVTGEARSMNLVSTTIATQDNQLLVIPNNTVWQNIITNITGSDIRRVDMLFSIGYDDDIELAQEIMQAALNEHPGVLDDPEPTIAVQNLGAVSVDLICRPWARTEDYWNVYRELTRDVKERFQASGLKPPYLQANLQIPAPMPEAPQPPAYPVS